MVTRMRPRLPRLDAPPITEVVCGVFFTPMPELDPVLLGGYWASIRDEFPRRELKAPLMQAAPDAWEFSLTQDIGPVRTWFISRDDVFIIQVQQDRFYLNWRMRGAGYPRFSASDGEPGLLSRFLGHFTRFSDFCAAAVGAAPSIVGLELAKIDQFKQDQHFRDPADLAAMAPMLAPVLAETTSLPSLLMRVSTPLPDGSLDIAWDSVSTPGAQPQRALKLECRRALKKAVSSAELRQRFEACNLDVNERFRTIVPDAQHHRFKKGAAS